MMEAFNMETKKDSFGYKRKQGTYMMGSEKYCDASAVHDVILYIANENKTIEYYGGVHCDNDPYEAIEEFYEVKENFNKSSGKQLQHLLIAFDCQVQRKTADKYARDILMKFFPEHQSFYGIHLENKMTHIHAAINTVSFVDGTEMLLTDAITNEISNYGKNMR